MRSDFFLELHLLLPLCLLLKNAPKKTFGHTNGPQGSQRSSKIKSNCIENIAFYQSGQCVSHTVNTMLFFTLALPKCNRKQRKKHTATHTLTLVSKIMKMLFKWLQSELPWTPETFHCSHFCDFDASLLSLFSYFFTGQKKH